MERDVGRYLIRLEPFFKDAKWDKIPLGKFLRLTVNNPAQAEELLPIPAFSTESVPVVLPAYGNDSLMGRRRA